MKLLYALESIRTPLLDTILGAVTHMGGELFFMVIAVTVFWCVSKRMGYYLMTVGFFGTILNQFLKILCCVPRPWVKNPDFTIVESARAEATGYSFPSGHTQNAVATYGGIARYTRRRWLRVVCIALTLVICFSRMYLGVHTPLDVGVSFVIAAPSRLMPPAVSWPSLMQKELYMTAFAVIYSSFSYTVSSTRNPSGPATQPS